MATSRKGASGSASGRQHDQAAKRKPDEERARRARSIADLFTLVSETPRLTAILLLADREMVDIGAICEASRATSSAMNHHLHLLRWRGFVSSYRRRPAYYVADAAAQAEHAQLEVALGYQRSRTHDRYLL